MTSYIRLVRITTALRPTGRQSGGCSPPARLRLPSGYGKRNLGGSPFPVSLWARCWETLLLAAAPLSCSTFDYNKPLINVNHLVKNPPFIPSLPFFFRSAKQFFYPGLPVHRDASGHQQRRRHAVPGNKSAGKSPVVNDSPSAGGTALLQHRRLTAVQPCQLQSSSRAPTVCRRYVRTGGSKNTFAPALRRRAGRGKSPHLLRADRNTGVPLQQRLHPGAALRRAVIPAGNAQKACGNQNPHNPHFPF